MTVMLGSSYVFLVSYACVIYQNQSSAWNFSRISYLKGCLPLHGARRPPCLVHGACLALPVKGMVLRCPHHHRSRMARPASVFLARMEARRHRCQQVLAGFRAAFP